MKWVIFFLTLMACPAWTQPFQSSANAIPGMTIETTVYFLIPSQYDVNDFQWDINYDAAVLTPDLTECGTSIGSATVSCDLSVGSIEIRLNNPDELIFDELIVIGQIAYTVSPLTLPPNQFSLNVSNDYFAGFMAGTSTPIQISPTGANQAIIQVYDHLAPGAVVGESSGLPGETTSVNINYLGSMSTATEASWNIPFDNGLLTADVSNCGVTLDYGEFTCELAAVNNIRIEFDISAQQQPFLEIQDTLLGSVAFTINPAASPQTAVLGVVNEHYVFAPTINFPPQAISPRGTRSGSIQILDDHIFNDGFD